MSNLFHYGTDKLTVSVAIAIASGKLNATLNDDTIKKINASQQIVEEIVADNKTVYGINTGFGILSHRKPAWA